MNTSHHDGGAPDVFLKTASVLQRSYPDANKRVVESWNRQRRKPRPLHEWFEMKDVHTWGVVNAERAILQLQELGEDITGWVCVRDYHQCRVDTITPKCERLFNQWNRCGGGQE